MDHVSPGQEIWAEWLQESHQLSLYSGSRIFRIVSTSNLEISGVGNAQVRPGCDGMIRASMGHHAQPVALSPSCVGAGSSSAMLW